MRLVKRVSDDNESAGTFAFSKAISSKTNSDLLSANEYVACYYGSTWSVWLVQNVNWDE